MMFNRRMKAGFKESRAQVGELNSQIEDSLLGIRVVKSFVREKYESEKFEKSSFDVANDIIYLYDL